MKGGLGQLVIKKDSVLKSIPLVHRRRGCTPASPRERERERERNQVCDTNGSNGIIRY